jgi:hypothetical protein
MKGSRDFDEPLSSLMRLKHLVDWHPSIDWLPVSVYWLMLAVANNNPITAFKG